MQQKDGWWVGQRRRYWCMSYNTDRVVKGDLPKTWDDRSSSRTRALQTVRVTEDGTRIAVKVDAAEPSDLTVGLTCEITYAGKSRNAIRLECP